jgi:hypothetical protein
VRIWLATELCKHVKSPITSTCFEDELLRRLSILEVICYEDYLVLVVVDRALGGPQARLITNLLERDT